MLEFANSYELGCLYHPALSELKIVDFVFILFYIYFLILNLELGYSMILHMTVTNYHICHSHNHMIYRI